VSKAGSVLAGRDSQNLCSLGIEVYQLQPQLARASGSMRQLSVGCFVLAPG
jgi:hypothetical protein